MSRISKLALVLLFFPCIGLGQRTTSTISGTVADPSGSTVPGASVSATQVSTGSTTRAQTNATGFYILTNLDPGTYTLRVEKSGFGVYVQNGIVLQVDTPVALDVKLQVGNVSQSVTVSAAGSPVNTRSQTVSYEVTPAMAVELPLNGRNIIQLQALAPDAGPTSSLGYNQSASRPEDTGYFVGASGGLGDSTAFYLDGAINEDALTQVANIYPNPDAIQEFSFETNNYSAKFGGRGGGVMNAVTKSGTNQFHGDAYEFLRYYSLNARNFFSPTQDGLKRNQFGATVGGPIQKDKMFFFFSYEGTTLRAIPSENIAATQTQAELAGNFSSTPTQLINPSTGAPFVNNQVSPTLFDPIALKILALVPASNPTTGVAQYTSKEVQNDKQFVTKVDRNFGEKVRIYGTYLYDGLTQPTSANGQDLLSVNGVGFGPAQYWRSQFAALNATWTIKPTLLANIVIGVSRRYNSYTGPPDFPTWTTLGANIPNMVTGGSKTSLDLSIPGYFSSFWDGLYTIPATAGDLATNWTWIKQNHTFEFGAEVEKTKVVKDQDYLSDGSYTFGGSLSGNNLLDFLLGRPSSFVQESPFFFVPQTTLPALYFTDTWKATRRLTLNLGLRWNPFVPVNDTAYHQLALFSQAAYNQGTESTLFPHLPPGLLVEGDPGLKGNPYHSYYGVIDPRIGFAYDVFGDGKTSIRGGFGMYQQQSTANTINPTFSPFSVNVTVSFPGSTANPYQGILDPFPISPPTPSNLVFPLPEAMNPYGPEMKAPTIQQWNVNVQHELTASTVLTVGYEGSESDHLFGSLPYNAAVYNPSLTRNQNLLDTNQRRPLSPSYQGISLGATVGTSSYNALLISVERRMLHGLTFLGGYRWAKCLDEGGQTFEEAFMDTWDYSSPNPELDRGACTYNSPNGFHFTYVWNLPSVKSLGFVGKNILSGWQSNGILTIQSGTPYSVTDGVDNTLTGIGLDRAQIMGNPSLASGRSTAQRVNEWFNTSAFALSPLGTYGDSPHDFLQGPNLGNFDFSLVKSIPIHESVRLDFRAESFNVFNRVNFSNPVSNYSSPSFGQVQAAGSPRIIQFALKLYF